MKLTTYSMVAGVAACVLAWPVAYATQTGKTQQKIHHTAVKHGTTLKAKSTLLPILPAKTASKSSTTPQHHGAAISAHVLVKLAEQATLSAFTYDHRNYRHNLNKTEKFFTRDGWKAYSRALRSSNNIQEVTHDSMIVSAKLAGHPRLIKQRFFDGKKAWQVQVPVQVSYNGKIQRIQQNLDVEITIVPVASKLSSKGIAIEQFIAKPAKRS